MSDVKTNQWKRGTLREGVARKITGANTQRVTSGAVKTKSQRGGECLRPPAVTLDWIN